MLPTLSHHCMGCSYDTPVIYTASVFSETHHCNHVFAIPHDCLDINADYYVIVRSLFERCQYTRTGRRKAGHDAAGRTYRPLLSNAELLEPNSSTREAILCSSTRDPAGSPRTTAYNICLAALRAKPACRTRAVLHTAANYTGATDAAAVGR